MKKLLLLTVFGILYLYITRLIFWFYVFMRNDRSNFIDELMTAAISLPPIVLGKVTGIEALVSLGVINFIIALTVGKIFVAMFRSLLANK